MSRTVEWTVWKARGETMRESARLSQRLAVSRRAGSRRTRTREDVAIITRMTLVEVARRKAEGRLVRIGPREYEVHLRVK